MVDIGKFVINTDFPVPAQVLPVRTGTVTIPAGTSMGTERSTSIQVDDAAIFRASITSSRAGKTFVGANTVLITIDETTYSVALGVSSAGSVTIRVTPNASGAATSTTAAETIAVSLSCFTLP